MNSEKNKITVSVRYNGKMVFHKSECDKFMNKDYLFADIYFEKNSRKIGIKFLEGCNKDSFVLTKYKGGTRSIGMKSILDKYDVVPEDGSVEYEAYFQKGKLIIDFGSAIPNSLLNDIYYKENVRKVVDKVVIN